MAATEATTAPRTRREDLLRKFEDATEWPLLLLALLMIPLLLLPLLTDVGHSTDQAIEATLWAIWAIFALELGIRTYLAEKRLAYLGRNWIDVLIVAVPFLRPLRVARSARALRALRLARVMPFVAKAWASTHNILKRRGLQYVLAVGVVTVFGAAAVVMAFERDDGVIDDYGTAIWWAMSTITTVGYGDTVPQTPEGRGVAVLLMLVGIAFFSWITANVAAFLVEFGGGEETGVTTHDIMHKLESLEEEIRQLRAEARGSPPSPVSPVPDQPHRHPGD